MRKLLFSILLVVGCASAEIDEFDKPVAFENREFWISSKVSGLEFPYRECAKKGMLGRCKEIAFKVDTYDFTDPAVREKFKSAGVVCKVKEKILP
jgi:hypothetical protein